MSTEVITALVTGLFTLAGVIITVSIEHKLTLYRIEQLEKKQDKHNSLIERTYSLEERINILDDRQKLANNRIYDLEHNNKVISN